MQAVCHGSSKITKATSKSYTLQALYVDYLQPWQLAPTINVCTHEHAQHQISAAAALQK